MHTMSTRRFELGLPLFSGLDLGALMGVQIKVETVQARLKAHAEAQVQAKALGLAFNEPAPDVSAMSQGITDLIATLGTTGELKAIRKLSTIWKASDEELRIGEDQPATLARLELEAADRPFNDTFKDAMDFHAALWASLGVSVVSSDPQTTAPTKAEESAPAPDGSPSAG